MAEKKLERMMMAMAKAHDEAVIGENERGAALALRCGNGMATAYWRAIAKAARKSLETTPNG